MNRSRRWYSLNNKSIKIGQCFNGRSWSDLEVFLLKFTSNGALVTENKVDLQRIFDKRCTKKNPQNNKPLFQDK